MPVSGDRCEQCSWNAAQLEVSICITKRLIRLVRTKPFQGEKGLMNTMKLYLLCKLVLLSRVKQKAIESIFPIALFLTFEPTLHPSRSEYLERRTGHNWGP
jgi:hypothetical protein